MLILILKDCPFCGPRAKEGERVEMTETRTIGADSYALGYTIRCGCCGIEMHDEYDTTLARRWNRRAADPVTVVRCSECGWVGESVDLGEEGECGGEGCHGSAVSEVTDPADLIREWIDSDGTVAGKQCADAGLIEPRPASEKEAADLNMEVGDAVWDVTEKGEAALRASKVEV